MNRVLINNIDHADLKVAIRVGAAFGDSVNQMPIFPSEFEEVQRHFPIVFRQGEEGMQAFALLGLDRDENLFLEGDRWTTAYVPASQRRGPFSMAVTRPQSEGEEPGEPMIHVDLDDARVGVEDGFPLFLQHGGNAPYLDHIAGVLRIIFEGLTSAPHVYATLEEAGLLQPVTMNIQINDEKGYDLPDLFVIDQQALGDLTGERLETLHRSGLLRAATMAAASLSNVSRLIDLKNKREAA
ncbi:SapC family protein [Sphingomonas sp. ASY06-1R]|uniref:SapC family protein n=1 Tax=Sphingomonas sp. ASY06-1R TaxID=3445771 RepID=UPI003FA32281